MSEQASCETESLRVYWSHIISTLSVWGGLGSFQASVDLPQTILTVCTCTLPTNRILLAEYLKQLRIFVLCWTMNILQNCWKVIITNRLECEEEDLGIAIWFQVAISFRCLWGVAWNFRQHFSWGDFPGNFASEFSLTGKQKHLWEPRVFSLESLYNRLGT